MADKPVQALNLTRMERNTLISALELLAAQRTRAATKYAGESNQTLVETFKSLADEAQTLRNAIAQAPVT